MVVLRVTGGGGWWMSGRKGGEAHLPRRYPDASCSPATRCVPSCGGAGAILFMVSMVIGTQGTVEASLYGVWPRACPGRLGPSP